MTAEERIEVDKILKYAEGVNIVAFKILNELVNMEVCEDAISRDQAIDLAEFVGQPATYDHPYEDGEEVVSVDDIKALPNVLPKRKTGYWIKTSTNACLVLHEYTCSCCGAGMFNFEYNFCPRCGSEMRINYEQEI